MKIIQPARYRNKTKGELSKQNPKTEPSSKGKHPPQTRESAGGGKQDFANVPFETVSVDAKGNAEKFDAVTASQGVGTDTPASGGDEILAELPKGKKRRRSELESHIAPPLFSSELDPAKTEFNQLLGRGMRLLSIREHSTKEITRKLLSSSEDADVVNAVIDELLQNKYLSDERFTESFIRSKSNKGHGPIKIRAELKNKGVSDTLIADYLNENATIWFDNAQLQYQKKYGNSPVCDYKEWSKRARFMQSRGFTSDHIQCAVQEFGISVSE